MIDLLDFTGKKILVVGASSGIGRNTAILVNKLGAEVILISRNSEKLKDTYYQLSGENNRYYLYDLSNIEGIEELSKVVVKENGAFNGIAYCAGKRVMKPLNMLKNNFLHDIMKVNLYAFIEIVRCFSKKNNYIEGMSIIGLSSVASDIGDKGNIAYCTSKSAMNGAVRAMAKELAYKKIRINTIKPGFIKTDMYADYVNSVGEDMANSHILNRQYLGLGSPSDISYMIAYLLSDLSKFMTGTEIAVDGGYLS